MRSSGLTPGGSGARPPRPATALLLRRMRLVVADTGPLNYLVPTSDIELLPKLFQRVLVPQAVRDELADGDAPAAVRACGRIPILATTMRRRRSWCSAIALAIAVKAEPWGRYRHQHRAPDDRRPR